MTRQRLELGLGDPAQRSARALGFGGQAIGRPGLVEQNREDAAAETGERERQQTPIPAERGQPRANAAQERRAEEPSADV